MHICLFLLLITVSGLALAGVTAGTLLVYQRQMLSGRTTELQEYGLALSNRISASGFPSVQGTQLGAELAAAANIFDGRIVVVDGNLKVVSDTFNYEVGKILISKPVIECVRGISGQRVTKGENYVELTLPVMQNGGRENVGAIILRASLEEQNAGFERVEAWMLAFDAVLMCAVGLVAFYASTAMVRPFKAIIASIQHVTDGYMEDVVSIRGFNEVERISDSFNEMLREMKKVEESRQEFVSNVSHELKTPMTSMKVLADSLIAQEEAPVEMYREFMEDINDEIEREDKIINDLLSLVKLGRKNGEMHIAQVSINELLEIILRRIKPLAQNRNIELVFESFRPVLATVDEVKLSLAISNLIENAVKYNVDEGNVRVSLNADHKYFYITVADSGIGIPEAAQPFVFDRFYRVDKARSRETGGTGLGLAITKSVILRHKGTIKLYSRENEGTTFTVRVPLSYIPD
ncbi:MAG: cell wall metabolism sensor histidine kinase WalK [Lachnospiraceae bacterium]|nr:cell wall metabolism sensor histidine kinase WalK [Lachnospiraceae bacterium]